MAEQRRLTRSRTNRVFAGICGGMGEYLDVDPTVIRVLWIVLSLLGGSGIILYILAYLIIPDSPAGATGTTPAAGHAFASVGYVIGVFLVVMGVAILFDNLEIFSWRHWWHLSEDFLLPTVIIIAGVALILRRRAPDVPASPPPKGSTKQSPPPPSSGRRLTRSVTDRKVAGVCGGMATFLGVDPTIIRLLFAAGTIVSFGAGILVYMVLMFVVPEEQPDTAQRG